MKNKKINKSLEEEENIKRLEKGTIKSLEEEKSKIFKYGK